MKKTDFEPNQNSIRNVKTFVTSAVLTAICLVLAFLAKSIFGLGPIRFTIENIPIIMGSFLYGPVVGALIAIAADLISCLISGMAPLPLITIGAASIGIVSGVLYKFILKKLKNDRLKIGISTVLAHIVGSMIIKTAALFPFYHELVLWRIPLYIGISAAETILLILLFENKAFSKQFLKK